MLQRIFKVVVIVIIVSVDNASLLGIVSFDKCTKTLDSKCSEMFDKLELALFLTI